MNQNWMQQALREAPWRLQRQAVALIGLGLFIAVIIGALYLAQSTANATLGRQLEDLIAQRNRLEQTNEQLRAEIAEYRTVSRLQARARELGFTESGQQNIEYLVIDGYNPNRVQTVDEPLPEQRPTLPAYDETFTGWLQQQWDNFTQQLQTFSSGGGS
jgi:cell division protein FtsL